MTCEVERGVRQLFLDDELVAKVSGLFRTIHVAQPQPGLEVMRTEYPWEAGVRAPCAIMRVPDTGRYRMWYQSMMMGRERWEVGGVRVPGYVPKTDKWGGPVHTVLLTCYVESEDGLHWERPMLRQMTFDGSLENNLIDTLDGGEENRHIGQGTNVFYDERDPDPKRRYKLYHPGLFTNSLLAA